MHHWGSFNCSRTMSIHASSQTSIYVRITSEASPVIDLCGQCIQLIHLQLLHQQVQEAWYNALHNGVHINDQSALQCIIMGSEYCWEIPYFIAYAYIMVICYKSSKLTHSEISRDELISHGSITVMSLVLTVCLMFTTLYRFISYFVIFS